jgi:hypothetical protein
MADKNAKDERETSARAQLAEIKERVQIRISNLEEADADIRKEQRALQRQQNQNNAARELLAWILNGDPPAAEPEAEESEVGEDASEEAEPE